MMSYHWPGNVRELENLTERAVIMAKDNNIINEVDLPIPHQKQQREVFVDNPDDLAGNTDMETFLSACEVLYITKLLKQCKGRIDSSARISGIDAETLY